MPVVLISGGTGLIGTALTKHLLDRNFEVVILSRHKGKASNNPHVRYSYWNVKEKIIDDTAVKTADHIVHLAGAGVMDKKWTDDYKKIIIDSRVKSAELLVNSLRNNEHRVKSFVSASAIGYYGPDFAPGSKYEAFTESDLPSKGFLGETCLLWEGAVEPVNLLGIRLVKLRTGIVLSMKGGAFKEYIAPLNFGVAPLLGSGKQIVSWVHIDDLCRMYCEAIQNSYLRGAYNAVAPEPVTQKQLILTAGQKMRNRFFIPIYVPSFVLKMMFGKRSIELLKSATVSDKKIKATGFTFLFPSIAAAVADLVANNKK